MSSSTSTRHLRGVLATTLFASAIAVGTAGLAQAEPREVDTPEYNACVDEGIGKGHRYEVVIEYCCVEAGAETLNDDNGEAFTCVTYETVEDSTQQPQAPARPPILQNPDLAPPPTPTSPPLIAPAPAPDLAPR